MHAKPRRHGGGDTYHGTNLRVSFDRKPGTIVLECEVAGPPSSKGRTVYVVFEADDLTDTQDGAEWAAPYLRGHLVNKDHAGVEAARRQSRIEESLG